MVVYGTIAVSAMNFERCVVCDHAGLPRAWCAWMRMGSLFVRNLMVTSDGTKCAEKKEKTIENVRQERKF